MPPDHMVGGIFVCAKLARQNLWARHIICGHHGPIFAKATGLAFGLSGRVNGLALKIGLNSFSSGIGHTICMLQIVVSAAAQRCCQHT
jgi:hypothetical protein